jgi:trehalose-6-phosphate synthase
MISDNNLLHLPRWARRLIFFATAIALAPKYLPIQFWSKSIESTLPTYASLLGGFCGVSILLVVGFQISRKLMFDSEDSL